MTGLFLSDLHLFSQRSIGQQLWDHYRPAISAAQTIVLGGDMFDFRWSQLGSLNATLDAASEWLTNSIALNPRASWVYLLGNHDCHPRLQTMLTSLSATQPNLIWTPGVWRIGSNLFLHGDVLDGLKRSSDLEMYRSGFHDEHPKGRLDNLLYSAVVQTRVHGVVPHLLRTRRQTCRRLLAYLGSFDADRLSGVRNIYFGHTHVPMSAFQFEGYVFHNAGCGIRHLTLAPVSFELT